MRLSALTLIAVSLVVYPASAEICYTVTDLGTLGGAESYGRDINEAGWVTGWAENSSGDDRAFLFDGTTMVDLGTLGGSQSAGHSINSSGHVAGVGYDASGSPRAMVHDGTTMHNLGILPGGGDASVAVGINDAGIVVGHTRYPVFDFQAFVYSGGTMTSLGTLGGTSSRGSDINNAGHMVGDAQDAAGNYHAYLHDGTTMHDLGTLGGTDSDAEAISESGLVAGGSMRSDGSYHAFLYDGAMHDLGILGGDWSEARDLNDSGQVVGSSNIDFNPDSDNHAFFYDGSTLHDLNNLIDPASGWVLWDAHGINSAGQITGMGLFGGHRRAYLLNPVPEPGSLAMLAGLAVMGLLCWRRRYKA